MHGRYKQLCLLIITSAMFSHVISNEFRDFFSRHPPLLVEGRKALGKVRKMMQWWQLSGNSQSVVAIAMAVAVREMTIGGRRQEGSRDGAVQQDLDP